MHYRESYAVSELIGIILVITIVSLTMIAVLVIWTPHMEDTKADVRADSALHQFDTMDGVLHDLISQGVNGSRIVNFVTDAGYLKMSDVSGTRFVIYYSLSEDFDFNVSDFDDEDETKFTFILEKPAVSPGDNYKFDFNVIYLIDDTNEEINDVVFNWGNKGIKDILVTGWLKDAIKIDIKNVGETEIIGRIWLFDVGSLSYEISSSSTTHKVISENGGVISGRYNSYYLFNEPKIYNNDGTFVMRIIQFKPVSETTAGGGGKATYRISMKVNNSFIRENKVNILDYFKMQVFGDYADAWKNYFTLKQGFSEFPDDDILYLQGNRIFTLTHLKCTLDLGVLG